MSSLQHLSLVPGTMFRNYPRVAVPLTSLVCTCGLLWLANVVITAVGRYRQLPSGPWGIPFLGYLPFMKKNKHTYVQFDELAKKYGPVFRFKFGGKHIVVISDWIHMEDAYINTALLGRPEQTLFPGIINHLSILEMSGKDWKEQRAVALQIFHNVTRTDNHLEAKVKEEIYRFIDLLKQTNPVDFATIVGRSVSNTVTILIFGHTYEYDDPVKMELDEQIEIIFREHQFAELLVFAPWLARMYIACGRANLDHVAEAVAYGDKFVQMEVDKHRENLDLNSFEHLDYIDGFLKEMARRARLRYPEGTCNLEVLKRNVFAFYGGGIETITSTMLWIIFYLISYPEMQDKIRDEIAKVIGFNRKPAYIDHVKMPFTLAFLNEVHRMGSVIAVNLTRRARCDVLLKGFLIPKDTYVLFNFWSIHRDPKLFQDPEKFDPTRFLVNEGTQVLKPAYLLPFSSGRRSCPGEGIANMELFLYLTCILQKFLIKVQPGSQISSEVHFGITRRPANLPPLIFEEVGECSC